MESGVQLGEIPDEVTNDVDAAGSQSSLGGSGPVDSANIYILQTQR